MSPDPKQSMEALKKGNDIRIKGARIRRRMAKGELPLEKAINYKDAQHLRVDWFLRGLDGWGTARVNRLLDERLRLDVGDLRLRQLTKEEKELIVKGVNDPEYWNV